MAARVLQAIRRYSRTFGSNKPCTWISSYVLQSALLSHSWLRSVSGCSSSRTRTSQQIQEEARNGRILASTSEGEWRKANAESERDVADMEKEREVYI